MLDNFQLAALVKSHTETHLLRIPLHQTLQNTLAELWQEQLNDLAEDVEPVEFDAGYNPAHDERFVLQDYQLPSWLAGESSLTVHQLDAITHDEATLDTIKAILAFARSDAAEELVLFQNFSRSHVIKPGQFLFLQNDTYTSPHQPGLTLGDRLSAVYRAQTGALLFRNFRNANVFLPLVESYEEASEQTIRELLAHKKLATEDSEALAKDANQWWRKRFAMLRDLHILDDYSAKQIQARAKAYDVDVKVAKNKVVFPANKPAAKKLLQFLIEERFRGPITNTLYETNSKKRAS